MKPRPNPRKSSYRENSSRAVVALSCALAGALGALGCTSADPGSGEGAAAADGQALRGTVVSYIASFRDGTSEKQYFLRTGGEDGPEQRLVFESDPELVTGTTVDVWGVELEDHVVVDRFAAVGAGPIGEASQALVNGAPYPPRTLAFVRVDLGGGFPDLTAEDANRRVFGMAAGDNSVKQYYLEVSYGRQDVRGEVVGPLPFTMNGCDTRGMTTALRAMVDAAASAPIQHYLWYMGTQASGCSWSGLAQTGSPQSPARDTWYNASEGCVVLVQEPGHNFGMQHSSALRCSGAPFADNPNGCQHEEYGDRYDPMGGGCRHMNVWQKAYQGWFGGCNSVKLGTSGTYTLLPTETPCDGIQVLQIPMAKARPFTRPAGGGGNGGTDQMRFFYLELRTRVGFDAQMMNAPTVLVHVADEYRTLAQGGRHTWILDMDPSTSTLDGLGQGDSYTDPAPGSGVSFTVQSLSAASATIQVTMPSTPPQGFPAQNTCLDGSTLTGAGPVSCGVGAGGTPGTGGMPGTAGAGGTSAGGAGGRGGSGGATMAGAGGSAAGAAGASSAGASSAGASSAGAPSAGAAGSAAGGGVAVAGAGGAPAAGTAGTATTPTSGAAGGSAGSLSVAGAGQAPFDEEINHGCGCRVPASPAEPRPAALALALVAAVSLWRRRRRS